MLRTLLAGLMLLLLAPVASAQDAPEDGIAATIQSQLDAFAARDIEAAWSYASPTIQRLFGSPERFGSMVRNGYPMVWDNEDVRFAELDERASGLWQRVQIIDESGTLHVLDYQMIETESGWQINAVTVVEAPQVGV